ncbi:HD domain-containing protein [Modestobacter sp. NPDC049651]|uniref:CCA tRNA nucleotidyltransferase n=1 Tax=Modestobacter sp. NPDC049651 TaxID=3155777 RepID=UPI0033F30874
MPGLVDLSATARALLDAVRAAGGRPYLVGGSVRDALLHPGRRPKDVDVEVFGLALDPLVESLSAVGQVDEVGRAFAVLKLRRGGEDFDVSLPRTEVKSGPGHTGFTVVADPATPPRVAAGRRDFTLNALMYDPVAEEVLDFSGGLADLRAGVLRHTTAAFAEDPLRVLRGAQFAARFGFRFAPETAALCRSLAPAYRELPTERVWGEWRKIGEKGVHVGAALAALDDAGWLGHFPQLARLAGVPQDPRWHPEGDVLTHSGLAADAAARLADAAGMTGDDRTVVVLGALVHDVGKASHTQVRADGRITSYGHAGAGVSPAEEFLSGIGAPPGLIARITPIVREHMVATGVEGRPRAAVVRRLARRLAPATIGEWSLVCGGDHAGRGAGSGPNPTIGWAEVAEEVGVAERPGKLLLRGTDLMALGHSPGPQYAPVMTAALDAQDDGAFTDHAGAVEWLAMAAADGRLDAWLAQGPTDRALPGGAPTG